MNMEEKILQIPIEDIIPNRFQPRLTFDDKALQELAQSIKEHGIIQPLVLRKLGDKYEIIAGERRYKAATMAGLSKVPAVISNIDDNKSAEVALVENIQRKNLTAIEEAKSYKNILDKGYLTQEQLAEKLGISQSTIANKMRLLNLCDEVQDALLNEKISERHARALLAVKDPTEQVKWLNKIINDRLTVRQLDIEIKKALRTTEDDDDESIPIVNLTPNIDEIKENALDINPTQGLHDIESMLKPSAPGEKEFDLSNPVDEVETLDIDDTPEEPAKPQNKFFNFLEDEEVKMNDDSSIDDVLNVFGAPVDPNANRVNSSTPTNNIEDLLNANNPDIKEENVVDNTLTNEVLTDNIMNLQNNNSIEEDNTIEQLEEEEPYTIQATINENIENSNNISNDSLDNDIIKVEPLSNIPENLENNNIIEPVTDDSNTIESIEESNNIEPISDDNIINNNSNTFFTTTPNNDIEIINEISENNNTIEEDNSIIEIPDTDPTNDVFDPMSMVNTLEPDYEEKQQEAAGNDLKTAINVIRDTKDKLESMGFVIELDEADTDDKYNFNINIIK